MIAGGGDLLDEMKALSEGADLPMVFMGWQHNLDALFSVSDILVMTSDNEGTPLSLIQAGMAGLPVVTTRVGSIPEIVLSERTGIVTGLGVREIADAIEKVITGKNLMLELGREAKEFTTTSFSIKRLVKNHEDLYRELYTREE